MSTPRPVSRLLIGRSCSEALRLLPCIFNLCPAAQTAAAAMAMEIPADPGIQIAIALETLREHALIMLRDWPRALGQTPDSSDLAGLAMLSGANLEALDRLLFGGDAEGLLAGPDQWAARRASSPAICLAVAAGWPKQSGRVAFDPDPTFIGRVMHHPAIHRIVEREGVTLFARMAARAIEAALLIQDIRSGEIRNRCGRGVDGQGWAEAARGRLFHTVSLYNGIIQDYRIDSPTDSMTGSGAFLQILLQSAASGPAAGRDDRIRMALSCADPCLPVVWRNETECHA